MFSFEKKIYSNLVLNKQRIQYNLSQKVACSLDPNYPFLTSRNPKSGIMFTSYNCKIYHEENCAMSIYFINIHVEKEISYDDR